MKIRLQYWVSYEFPLLADSGPSGFGSPAGKPDNVDGSLSRHLSSNLGCCQANPSKGTICHGEYDNWTGFDHVCFQVHAVDGAGNVIKLIFYSHFGDMLGK